MELRFLYVLLSLFFVVSCDFLDPKKKIVKLAPCDLCKRLVESFFKGIERTARDNFAGGDTAWEEEKLGSYHRSEVRLVEVQEKLCLDVQESEAQCHSFAEDVEADLESWWFEKVDSHSDLEKWLCITTKRVCCEFGHYGPECVACPGYPDAICNGRGTCMGEGTRSGSGKCACNIEYGGKFCESCAVNYFESPHKKGNVCTPCHKSCKSGCSDATAKGCKKCKPGWLMKDGVGCVDVDECKTSKNLCHSTGVCVNIEGSYKCEDFRHLGTKDPGKWVRYVTYVSFLIATGIFFRKSVMLGCFVGMIAAIYVSMSEIVMSDYIDLFKFELKNLFADIMKNFYET